jgi:hypothetical protein
MATLHVIAHTNVWSHSAHSERGHGSGRTPGAVFRRIFAIPGANGEAHPQTGELGRREFGDPSEDAKEDLGQIRPHGSPVTVVTYLYLPSLGDFISLEIGCSRYVTTVTGNLFAKSLRISTSWRIPGVFLLTRRVSGALCAPRLPLVSARPAGRALGRPGGRSRTPKKKPGPFEKGRALRDAAKVALALRLGGCRGRLQHPKASSCRRDVAPCRHT